MATNYFRHFPDMDYDIRKDGVLHKAKDLFRQVRVFGDKEESATGYEYMHVGDGDRPDATASKVYGDSTLYWLFWLVNDHLTVWSDWPRSNFMQEKYIDRKYAGTALVAEVSTSIVSSADSKFTMGEKITGSISNATGYAINIDPTFNQAIVNDVQGVFQTGETVTGSKSGKSFTLYSLADYKDRPHHYIDGDGNKTTVYNALYTVKTNAEHERELNDDARFLKYIPVGYSHQIIKEFRDLIRE